MCNPTPVGYPGDLAVLCWRKPVGDFVIQRLDAEIVDVAEAFWTLLEMFELNSDDV